MKPVTKQEIIELLFDSSELVLVNRNALASLAERIKAEGIAPHKCVWTDEDFYETSCGHTWVFNDGSPEDNNANFCPFCGGKIVVPKQEDV